MLAMPSASAAASSSSIDSDNEQGKVMPTTTIPTSAAEDEDYDDDDDDKHHYGNKGKGVHVVEVVDGTTVVSASSSSSSKDAATSTPLTKSKTAIMSRKRSSSSSSRSGGCKWRVTPAYVRALKITGLLLLVSTGVVLFILSCIPGSLLQRGFTALVAFVQDGSNVVIGCFIFFFIYILTIVFALPATPLNLASGYIYEFWIGSLVSILGITAGAMVAFGLGRTLMRSWAESKIQANAKFRAIDRAVGESGWVLIFLFRLSPVMPFAIFCYILGATRVRIVTYATSTIAGLAIPTAAYCYLGTLMSDISQLWDDTEDSEESSVVSSIVWIVFAAVTTVGIVAVVTWITRRALAKSMQEDADLKAKAEDKTNETEMESFIDTQSPQSAASTSSLASSSSSSTLAATPSMASTSSSTPITSIELDPNQKQKKKKKKPAKPADMEIGIANLDLIDSVDVEVDDDSSSPSPSPAPSSSPQPYEEEEEENHTFLSSGSSSHSNLPFLATKSVITSKGFRVSTSALSPATQQKQQQQQQPPVQPLSASTSIRMSCPSMTQPQAPPSPKVGIRLSSGSMFKPPQQPPSPGTAGGGAANVTSISTAEGIMSPSSTRQYIGMPPPLPSSLNSLSLQ